MRIITCVFVGLLSHLFTTNGTAQVQFGSNNYTVGTEPSAIVTADLNEDGYPDLLVASRADDVVHRLLGSNSGIFLPGTPVPVGNAPNSIAVGDINNDGHVDMVVANQLGSNVTVRLGDGLGGFGASTTLPAGLPRTVLLVHLNNDSWLDLVVATDFGHPGATDSVHVYLGNGSGTYGAFVQYPLGLDTWSIVVDDVDADGDTDLLVSCRGLLNSIPVHIFGGEIYTLFNDGAGTFTSQLTMSGGSPAYMLGADVNGNGHSDLVIHQAHLFPCMSDGVSIVESTGAGTYSSAVTSPFGCGPHQLAAQDFDGNGTLDIAIGSSPADPLSGFGEVTLQFGLGDGSFPLQQVLPCGAMPGAMLAADLNGDGQQDLVVLDEGSDKLIVFLNQGGAPGPFLRGDANGDGQVQISDPVFVLGYLFSSGAAPVCPDSADSNDDGALDLSDAIHLLGYIFGLGGPLPPSPFPTCGADPTADALPLCLFPGLSCP